MKTKILWLIAGCLIFVVIGATQYTVLQTIHVSYDLLRTEANEDSDLLDLTTEGNFASKPSEAVQLKPNDSGVGVENTLQLVYCGGSAADKTFTYKIYMWRKTNGMAELVCTGTGTLGTQAVVKYPHNKVAATSKFWADTLTCTDRWLKTVTTTASTGSNEVAKLLFDTCGYEWAWVEITDADGSTGTEAGNISVYYSYF